jgi:ATP-binding cassette subfamily C protein LapB
MKELLRRLQSKPLIAGEMAFGSLLVNIMALASPLFVMQVLNRYVGQGVDATLYTLTAGVLLAIVFEFALRQSRMALARGISAAPDADIAERAFDTLTRARAQALDKTAPEARCELVNGTQAIETAYSATNITTILDAPFALLFILVLYILEPLLAGITAIFVIGVYAVGALGHRKLQTLAAELQAVTAEGSGLLGTAAREGDMIRSFNAGALVRRDWEQHIEKAQNLRRDMNTAQGMVQTVTGSAMALMSVAIIGTGAALVVAGTLDVGAMIGANILAARALQPVTRLAGLGAAFARARQSLEIFDKLAGTELEADTGTRISALQGRIEFRDAAFMYPESRIALFEGLNLAIGPGDVLTVIGNNGAGKSTTARLLMRLIEPVRGQILIDGVDLKQLDPAWWRKQVVFLPQEPALLNATIGENIAVNNPDLDAEALGDIVERSGLRKFIDESADGLDTRIADNGWRLAEGIRRRVALARALATDGQIVVIDEPTESLDEEGCRAVYRVLAGMAEQKRTIIVMSHDPDIVKGPHTRLDLNMKPRPGVERFGQKQLPKPLKKLEGPDTKKAAET